MASTTLSRPHRGDGRIIAGVCGGLAHRFGLSTFMVRLLFVLFGIVGAGEIAYIIRWIIKPNSPR